MNALERLAQAGKTNSVGSYTFVDADTLRDSQDPSITYRLQGYDAPEVAGFKGGKWTAGTAGAADATREITSLAEKQGYTNLVKTGKFDPNGREIVELHDENGRNFTTELLKSGALDAGKYATQSDVDAIDVANAFGNNNDDFDKAAQKIQSAVDEETLRPVQMREAAINEAMYGAGFGTAALSFRKNDRDIKNNAYNPMSDAWQQGWIGAKEGYYGFLELMGQDVVGNEWLADIGEAGIARAQAQQQEYGKVLTDWQDVNGIKSGVAFVANNAAMSMPYMITTAAAGLAGTLAAPVVGTVGALGIGLSAPAMVYSGQTWNEMEGEKSAEIALGAGLVQASLDRLGIGAIAGKFAPKSINDLAVKKIMKNTGVTREAAETTLANATKFELAEVLKESSKIAAAQVAAAETGKAFLKSAASEGVTEVLQEATAYMAATQGSDKEFDWNELNKRMTAAAIAGSTLGGAFSVPGSVGSIASKRALIGDNMLADETTARQSALWAEEEKKHNGYVATNQENLANVHAQVANEGSGFTLSERAEAFRKDQKRRTLEERASDAFNAIPSLWRGATRNIFSDDVLARSRSARIAADLFGGNPDRVFSGASFEDAKHHRVSQYKNMIPIPEQIYSVMNGGKKFSSADKERISGEVYSALNNAVGKDGKFNPALVPEGKFKQTIIQLGTQINALADKMHADQKKHNPELGYIGNYLFKYKALNKKAVHKNRANFERLLQTTYKIPAAEAKELTDRIVNDINVADVDEAFSVVKGGIVPASHKKRTLGLSEKKEFQEFMERDMFANISQAAKSAARFTAHRDFIGKDGAVVSKLLDNIQKELGNDEAAIAKVDQMSAQMQDYLDAESGNYKRPSTGFGKKAQAVQKNAMMLMTFSGLPLAVFSSIVEAALVGRGLNRSQIFGKDKISLRTQGTDLAKGLVGQLMDVTDVVKGKTGFSQDSENEARIRDLGFYSWDVGAATVTGVTEVNAWQQKMYDAFFKANGLTQWTDYTRAIRASFAGDFVSDNARVIYEQRKGGQPYTKEIQETELKLRNVGINIDRFLPIQEKVMAGLPLTPKEQAFYDEQIRDASFNFVNDAIVLPQSANRPLIYQDPRFALFTQFQGFLSTFTTKVLPKLWRDATGGSTPTMQYQAWATMATMIMLGFASQAMKDWIKYDLDPGEEDYEERRAGGNPYLDTPEYIRRGLLSTGLLGTGERVINAMFPIYEQRSDNPGDWLFNQAVGESPALGYIERVAGAAGALAKGDTGRAAEQAFKAAPVFGPFSAINKSIGNVAGDWNFDGG